MLTLCSDIFLKIGEHLTDREKICLSRTTKNMVTLQHKFIYREKIKISTIIRLPYWNNFEYVEILDSYAMRPKFAKYIYFLTQSTNIPFNLIQLGITHLTFANGFVRSIKDKIPPTVTHLTFGHKFDKSIKCSIPLSVTHLTFGYEFNQRVNDDIPSSITHLTFGNCFNQPIYDSIPSSVTHLTFGCNFNKRIYKDIPLSVTHLIFGTNFNQPISDSIPSSVTHLIFGCDFDKPIKDNIPSSVKYIKFGYCFKQSIYDLPSSIMVIVLPKLFGEKIFDGALQEKITWA